MKNKRTYEVGFKILDREFALRGTSTDEGNDENIAIFGLYNGDEIVAIIDLDIYAQPKAGCVRTDNFSEFEWDVLEELMEILVYHNKNGIKDYWYFVTNQHRK